MCVQWWLHGRVGWVNYLIETSGSHPRVRTVFVKRQGVLSSLGRPGYVCRNGGRQQRDILLNFGLEPPGQQNKPGGFRVSISLSHSLLLAWSTRYCPPAIAILTTSLSFVGSIDQGEANLGGSLDRRMNHKYRSHIIAFDGLGWFDIQPS